MIKRLVQEEAWSYRTLLADEGSKLIVYRTETDGFKDIEAYDSVQHAFGKGKKLQRSVKHYMKDVGRTGGIDASAALRFQYDQATGQYYRPFKFLFVW